MSRVPENVSNQPNVYEDKASKGKAEAKSEAKAVQSLISETNPAISYRADFCPGIHRSLSA